MRIQQVPDPQHPKLIILKLCQRLRHNDPTLLEIKLHGAMVTLEQAKSLAEVLPYTTHLHTVDLCMVPDGVKIIALALSYNRNKSIQTLSFRLCPISSESAYAIAHMLSTNTYCKKLHLFFSCLVGIEGISAIAKSLTTNKSLVELILTGSGLGDYGVFVLALALKENTTLLNLNLGHTLTSDVGVKSLAIMLQINKSLLKLDLSQTLVKADGIAALADVLENRNTTLQHTPGYFNKSASQTKQKLDYYLHLNRSGRGVLQDIQTSSSLVPLLFNETKGNPTNNPDALFGLLRELPHLWTEK